MKTTLALLAVVLLIPAAFAVSLVAQTTSPPEPRVVTDIVEPASRSIDPQQFQAMALTWIAVGSTVFSALLAAVAMLWTKVNDLRHRADRQSDKSGSLQEQVTNIALQTPVITPAVRDAIASEKRQGGTLTVAILALVPALFFTGCAYRNPTPSPAVRLHKLRAEPSGYDRWYTDMANKGARGGNPPSYVTTPDWKQPFGTFSDFPM